MGMPGQSKYIRKQLTALIADSMVKGRRVVKSVIQRLNSIAKRFSFQQTKLQRSHGNQNDGTGIEWLCREELLRLSLISSHRLRLAIFRHLLQLKNFSSAAKIGETFSFEHLSDRDALLVIQSMIASTSGVLADSLLRKFIRDRISWVSSRALRSVAEFIRVSGLDPDEKISLIQQVIRSRPNIDSSALFALRWAEFRIKDENLLDSDILNYVVPTGGPLRQVACLSYLQAAGHHDVIDQILNDLSVSHSVSEYPLVAALLEYRPGWLEDNYHLFDGIAKPHLQNASLLELLARIPSTPDTEKLLETCKQHQIRAFSQAGPIQRDAILRTFIKADLLHEALGLLEETEKLPDTVLSRIALEGYRFFLNDDYRSAEHCFYTVLRENPGDSFAGMGLRYALPRNGKPMDAILDVRDCLGYGTRSSGRASRWLHNGIPGPDVIFSLLMAGRHLEGHHLKRYAPNYRLLKKHFGEKFLNFEIIPTQTGNKRLFVIGDDGVGDEVRAAQFYGQLLTLYKHVTISCDPRLYRIFSHSFPGIKFIPVARYRKALRQPRDDREQRLAGFNKRVSDILTERCRSHLEAADHITMSQGLVLNYFAGRLSRPSPGPYLRSPLPPRLPKAREGIRVGLLWRSHFNASWRKCMYMRLEDFLPLTTLHNVELWSIQHAIDDHERHLCRSHGIRLIEDVDLFNDFEGLGSYLQSMDLLIGISSLPIELGAALGVPIWLLGFSPENYFLRTDAGRQEHDCYTLNSIIVKPAQINFASPRAHCCMEILNEVIRKLQELASGVRVARESEPFENNSAPYSADKERFSSGGVDVSTSSLVASPQVPIMVNGARNSN